jgi:catechol 2,3-dioxygenase-like lactoylglutathione lyase family enzyme
MIKEFDHVGINVRDLDKSIQFYEKTLGFSLTGRHEIPEIKLQYAFLKRGPAMIELVKSEKPSGPTEPSTEPGKLHIALGVDDLESEYKKLKDKNVTCVLEPIKRPKEKFAIFRDPEGVEFELIERI